MSLIQCTKHKKTKIMLAGNSPISHTTFYTDKLLYFLLHPEDFSIIVLQFTAFSIHTVQSTLIKFIWDWIILNHSPISKLSLISDFSWFLIKAGDIEHILHNIYKSYATVKQPQDCREILELLQLMWNKMLWQLHKDKKILLPDQDWRSCLALAD